MARIRSIHPDSCKSEKLHAASAEAERVYWRLLPQCDDEGRCEDDPRVLRSHMFPLDDGDIRASQVDVWLGELESLGLLVRYEVAGKPYLQVLRWSDYQKPQKKVESKLPPLPEDYATPTRRLPEDSAPTPVDLPIGEGVGDGVGEVVLFVPQAALTVSDVFEFWQSECKHPRARLDDKRKRRIEWAIRNYPAEDIRDAILGAANSGFHQGQNPNATVYDDIELICRDASKFERFRDGYRNGPVTRIPKAWGALQRIAQEVSQ